MADGQYTAAELEQFFAFLDDLRESGVTNMLAAAPYLGEAFGLDEGRSRTVLHLWISTFKPQAAALDRALDALAQAAAALAQAAAE